MLMCEVPVSKYWTVAKPIEQVRTDLITEFKNEPWAIFILNLRIILSNLIAKVLLFISYEGQAALLLVTDVDAVVDGMCW